MPRTRSPRTAVDRAAEADARLVASGGKVARFRMSAAVNRRAATIMAERGETFTALVERAIMALPD